MSNFGILLAGAKKVVLTAVDRSSSQVPAAFVATARAGDHLLRSMDNRPSNNPASRQSPGKNLNDVIAMGHWLVKAATSEVRALRQQPLAFGRQAMSPPAAPSPAQRQVPSQPRGQFHEGRIYPPSSPVIRTRLAPLPPQPGRNAPASLDPEVRAPAATVTVPSAPPREDATVPSAERRNVATSTDPTVQMRDVASSTVPRSQQRDMGTSMSSLTQMRNAAATAGLQPQKRDAATSLDDNSASYAQARSPSSHAPIYPALLPSTAISQERVSLDEPIAPSRDSMGLDPFRPSASGYVNVRIDATLYNSSIAPDNNLSPSTSLVTPRGGDTLHPTTSDVPERPVSEGTFSNRSSLDDDSDDTFDLDSIKPAGFPQVPQLLRTESAPGQLESAAFAASPSQPLKSDARSPTTAEATRGYGRNRFTLPTVDSLSVSIDPTDSGKSEPSEPSEPSASSTPGNATGEPSQVHFRNDEITRSYFVPKEQVATSRPAPIKGGASPFRSTAVPTGRQLKPENVQAKHGNYRPVENVQNSRGYPAENNVRNLARKIFGNEVQFRGAEPSPTHAMLQKLGDTKEV
jgi:hypothetical protein